MSEENTTEGENKVSAAQRFPWLRASVFMLVLFFVITPFTSVPRELKELIREMRKVRTPVKQDTPPAISKPVAPKPEVEQPAVEPEIEPRETATQEHFLPTKGDMIQMSKGFVFDYKLETSQGDLASVERKEADSYVAEYRLKVKLPKASQSLEELSKVNPKLPTILPGLGAMLEKSKVSPFYFSQYKNKVDRLEREVVRLNELSTKHNFYDCETVLNLTSPKTGRKLLLMQADMDVVSDGSDGDRLPVMPAEIVNSTNYQPFTSYGWKKTSKTPNPMVAGWQARMENAKKELAESATPAARKAWLQSRMKMLERGIADMKARSFLIAEYDPFIVMPVDMLRSRKDAHAARVGDYAVVIAGDKVYPAIVGDGGPTFKVGEGSLRLAKEINANAGIYSRPVSDLTVTYLVFSNSREIPARAPDYARWKQRCAELLDEVGGLGEGVELHEWKDLLAPEPVEPTEPAAPDAPTPEVDSAEAAGK